MIVHIFYHLWCKPANLGKFAKIAYKLLMCNISGLFLHDFYEYVYLSRTERTLAAIQVEANAVEIMRLNLSFYYNFSQIIVFPNWLGHEQHRTI